jgi:hypothetical protein
MAVHLKPSPLELVNLIIELHQKGYDQDFLIHNNRIKHVQSNNQILLDDLNIIEILHFYNEPKSDNSCYIFAIQLQNSGIKGILLTSKLPYCRSIFLRLFNCGRVVNYQKVQF